LAGKKEVVFMTNLNQYTFVV